MRNWTVPITALALALLLAGCANSSDSGHASANSGHDGDAASAPEGAYSGDPHSFANPDMARVTHLSLDVDVKFDRKQVIGSATWDVDVSDGATKLELDTRDLDVFGLYVDGEAVEHEWGSQAELLGRELIVPLAAGTEKVTLEFATSPNAIALQWLEPSQTSGDSPFLYSQAQPTYARSMVPCQDTPGVRFTYDATVRVPTGLMALMSADNPTELAADGVYRFKMDQPVPSYLLALAVGDVRFKSMGRNTGVYAEPAVVEKAAWEFAETQAMLDAIEPLYGEYLWDQFDVLVLPPSFPYGGMENPRLTFATPTIIAGDRSLTALIAHELAHSWSGNLVTNANWNDLWMNEGFTVYLERRIMEMIKGRDYSEMLAVLGRQDLTADVEALGETSPMTALQLDLAGKDPEESFSDVAYEKGYLFLRTIEETIGRETFDPMLRAYFDKHRFQSVTTQQFVDHLSEAIGQEQMDAIGVHQWIYEPGIPANQSVIESGAFDDVDAALARWSAGEEIPKRETDAWDTQQWIHFVRSLPEDMGAEGMARLEASYQFTESGNSEIVCEWLQHSIVHGYRPAEERLENFLLTVGRRKFLRPLYKKLMESPGGKERALEIYTRARPTYHSIATDTIDAMLEYSP